MRHIGYKVTPHDLCPLKRSDIAGQHQQTTLAIRVHLQRQLQRMRICAGGTRHCQLVAKVTGCPVGNKCGVAQQIAQVLLQVTPRIKPKMIRRCLIRPLDSTLGIEQYNPVGRSLQSRHKIIQPGLTVYTSTLALPQQTAYPI